MTDRVDLLGGIVEDPGVIDIDQPGPEARAARSVRTARRGAAEALVRGELREGARSDLSEQLVSALLGAVLTEVDDRCDAVLGFMGRAQIGIDDIVDLYVPEVARRLGQDWHDNRRSFSDVTIGAARLQGLLRELAGRWEDGLWRDLDCPAVAVVVLENEFHTLGAVVLSQQLRRLGVSVQLIVGQSEAEIIQCVAQDRFDAILVSVSRSECLASLRKLVEKLRRASVHPTQVVVGGAAIGDEGEIRILTGADHVATDAGEALIKCGLKSYLKDAVLRTGSA
jgi:MerR family transcriptional regulator, light-induced transcriptional regulator